MLQSLKKNLFQISIIILVVAGFASLRFYQEQIFNDPFIPYFKSNYHTNSYPNIEFFSFYGSMLIRYSLNTFLSLLVIYTLFNSKLILNFVFILYAILGCVLFILLVWEIHFAEIKSNFLLFYIRRFLIQPIFLLLFIPALYFQRKSQS
jgi:exosortase F-associated protein